MKLFEKIIANVDKISDINFTRDTLLEYNLVKIFSPIYAINKEVQIGNICTSFIILTYSNGCRWADYKKDIITIRSEIIDTLISNSKLEINEEKKLIFVNIINGENEIVENVIYDFVLWQKNGLFETLIALSTQISLCRRKASSSFGVTEKMLNDRGKFLENLRDLEQDLKEVMAEIESEYSQLDEILKVSGKTPISALTDVRTWEDLIKIKSTT